MAVLFCEYLCNESSDPDEILCGGQLLSYEDAWISTSTRVVNMRAPILLRVCAFTTRAHAFVHKS